MNKTYIKNKGTTTFISSIPGNECNGNDNYNKVDWNIDYDGNRANIEMDINSNGRMKHVNYELTNDDLEDMLNVPAFKMPIEDRLLSDFPLNEKDAIILPSIPDELILSRRKNTLFKPTKNHLPKYKYSTLIRPLLIKNANSNESIKTKTIKRRKNRKQLDYSLKNKLKTPSVKTKRVVLKSKKPNASIFNF
jgi:hypothetical protein